MIDEMFQIVIDPIYPPTKEYKESVKNQPKNFEIIY